MKLRESSPEWNLEAFSRVIDKLVLLQMQFRKNIKVKITGDNVFVSDISWLTINHPIIHKKQKVAEQYKKTNDSNFDKYLNIRVINWAIICFYNSKDYKPDWVESRWDHKIIEINWVTISMIQIDISEDERKDWVSVTTSLHHEYQHHLNTIIWDSLLYEETWYKYNSLERNSDRFIWVWWIHSRAWLTYKDFDFVRWLFWRDINLSENPNWTIDYDTYLNQMYYLDELSASFWQWKPNTFWPKELFYNNRDPKVVSHYELIWSNNKDKQYLKELFRDYIMPWHYLHYLKWEVQKSITEYTNKALQIIWENKKTNPWEEYLEKIDMIQAYIIQILWTSRTIKQALNLIRAFWKNVVENPNNWLKKEHLDYIIAWWKQLHQYL